MAALNTLPPSLLLILDLILESRGEITTYAALYEVNQMRLKDVKDVDLRLDRTLQDLVHSLLLPRSDMTNNPEAVDYDTMTICALHQAPSGMVNCNICNTTHVFYQCPTLHDMDEEAQKHTSGQEHWRNVTLRKRNIRLTKYTPKTIVSINKSMTTMSMLMSVTIWMTGPRKTG